MPEAHRVGFKRGEPGWEAIGGPDGAELPAVRWKQLNLDRLDAVRRETPTDRLRAACPPVSRSASLVIRRTMSLFCMNAGC